MGISHPHFINDPLTLRSERVEFASLDDRKLRIFSCQSWAGRLLPQTQDTLRAMICQAGVSLRKPSSPVSQTGMQRLRK